MLSKYDNIIFDLDGTLVDSSEEVLNCFKKAFEVSKYNLDNSKLTNDIIGPPIEQIIQNLAPDLKNGDTINKIIQNFRKIYDNDTNDITVLYEGIIEILEELKRNNKNIFIATLKPIYPTLRVLKMLNIEHYFTEVYSIDKFGKPITKAQMIDNLIDKYNLEKKQTVMVGDSLSDIEAGNKVGVDTIGVHWGYGSNKSDLEDNATYIVKKVSDIYN